MTMTSINNHTSFFDYHQQYQEVAPSKKIIQELSHHDRVQDNNIAAGMMSTSPKRKRDDHVFVSKITLQKRQHEVNNDAGYCPGQKYSESSIPPFPTYSSTCMSSYDVERRDGPSDDDILLDDETACLVSNCCMPVFRQERQQRGIPSSDKSTPQLLPAIFTKNGDENEKEKVDSYLDFPSIVRARTITDSFDSIFSKRCCYADPPEMDEPVEDWRTEDDMIEENHKSDRSDSSAHILLGFPHHELNDASDETRECPERIASTLWAN